jgi:hypothetical protein
MFCHQVSGSISCVRQSRFLSRLQVLTLITACLLALPHPALSQAQAANAGAVRSATVPRLIRYQGVARDLESKPLTGLLGLTFSLYADQNGGEALWMETQNVQADAAGHYSVLLGSTKNEGMPSELFASAQARWIGVQIEQQAEQPRSLLVSAPYALKAVDADTLGGLPPSAFVHVNSEEAGSSGQSPASPVTVSGVTKVGGVVQPGPQAAVTTSGGTAKTIPMFTTATNIQNSILTQTGTTELNATASAAAGSAPIIWLKNSAAVQTGSTGNSIDLRFSPDKSGTVAKPDAYIRAQETGSSHTSTSLQFGTLAQGASTAAERMRITASGLVGVGTVTPGSELEVDSQSISLTAISAVGASASPGSLKNGSDGLTSTGGTGDDTNHDTGQAVGGDGIVATAGDADGFGGNGVVATGGIGAASDGVGGTFHGGNSVAGGDGIDAFAGSGYAGYFDGNVLVFGTLSASTKDFKIDHPLDPANKYLVHASVESSEMKNIYDGTVTTDSEGNATVSLPSWFEALNTDFRYQLTVIGQFAQAIVSRKVQNNQFGIKTSLPNVEVSWQLTGVRHDAYATANPLVVEEEKEARLRGFFIHPELHGAPADRQIGWARHPQMMKKMQQQRQQVKRKAAQQLSVSAQK